MNQILERYKNQIAGVILIVALAVTAYMLFGPKPSPPEFGPIQSIRPDLQSRVVVAQVTEGLVTKRKIPSKMQVYKLDMVKDAPKKAAKIAAVLGFPGKSKSNNPYTWNSGKKELTISKDLTSVDYKDNGIKVVKIGKGEEELAKIASDILKRVGLAKDGLVQNPQPVYYGASRTHLVGINKFEDAAFIEFSFDQKLDGYFLYERGSLNSAALLILNKKGQLLKLNYKYQRIEKSQEYPIKTLADAIDDISSRGILVNIDPEGEKIIKIRQFNEIVVEDAFVSYVQKQQSKFIQPVFVFRGIGKIIDYSTDVVIQVPALPDIWLK